jgi:hypothetical protein
MVAPTMSIVATLHRYSRFVQFSQYDECWYWTGCVTKAGTGYGLVQPRGEKLQGAHRWFFRMSKGEIPKGMHLDHLCRHSTCVNPEHLEIVTPRENTMRGIGPSAINVTKTNCPKGHLYAGDNLYVTSEGFRQCKECVRQRSREWQRKNRGKNAKR